MKIKFVFDDGSYITRNCDYIPVVGDKISFVGMMFDFKIPTNSLYATVVSRVFNVAHNCIELKLERTLL